MCLADVPTNWSIAGCARLTLDCPCQHPGCGGFARSCPRLPRSPSTAKARYPQVYCAHFNKRSPNGAPLASCVSQAKAATQQARYGSLWSVLLSSVWVSVTCYMMSAAGGDKFSRYAHIFHSLNPLYYPISCMLQVQLALQGGVCELRCTCHSSYDTFIILPRGGFS